MRVKRLLPVLLLTWTGMLGVAAEQPALSGLWRLHETSGDFPEQAVRALEGKEGAPDGMTIQLEQSETAFTVRRHGTAPAVLRVMPFSADVAEHQVPGGGKVEGRAEWRDGTVVATGRVAVKQGFLTRKVPFEEVWQLDDEGRTLTVRTTLRTPLGVKHRTQVFVRMKEHGAR